MLFVLAVVLFLWCVGAVFNSFRGVFRGEDRRTINSLAEFILDLIFSQPDFERWAFMSTYDIYTVANGVRSLYIRRYHIIKCPWFGVYIHKIYRSDSYRDMHDHPFAFWVWILKGHYFEETPNGKTRRWSAGDRLRRAATWRHRVYLDGLPAWTLFCRGKKVREWGFITEDGWVHNELYKAARRAEEHHGQWAKGERHGQ